MPKDLNMLIVHIILTITGIVLIATLISQRPGSLRKIIRDQLSPATMVDTTRVIHLPQDIPE